MGSANQRASNIFSGGNPFAKKPSRFTKTLIATPSKFEIKVEKKKPVVSLGSTRSSRSAASKKPENKSVKPSKIEKKSKIDVPAKKSEKVNKAPKIDPKSKAIKKKQNQKLIKMLKMKAMKDKMKAKKD